MPVSGSSITIEESHEKGDFDMPKKTFNGYEVTYTVKTVTVTEDSSVGKYKGKDDLNEVMAGLKKTADWTVGFEVTPVKGKTATSLRANGYGFPGIDKHPGHVEGKGWKYNVEPGNGSVDRLVVSDTASKLSNEKIDDKTKKISVDVAITCKAKVLENTH